jgi:hypothetical protein
MDNTTLEIIKTIVDVFDRQYSDRIKAMEDRIANLEAMLLQPEPAEPVKATALVPYQSDTQPMTKAMSTEEMMSHVMAPMGIKISMVSHTNPIDDMMRMLHSAMNQR